MELKLLLVVHIFSAMVWMGGLLIITLGVLPGAWKKNDPDRLETFLKPFERIGYPALLFQILTGFRLAMKQVSPSEWFSAFNVASWLVTLKFILFGLTVFLILLEKLAINKQSGKGRMNLLGLNTLALTLIAILFVLTGLSFRFGILV
ncbi:MAG: copper transporter [Chlorobi bacterium]|nr:copper transporter [Chlorobiota bacterium]